MEECLAMNDKKYSSIVVESHLNHLDRLRQAVENAAVVMGCCADIVHLVSGKDFVYALERFKKFNNFPIIAAATTEFEIIKERLWTETFVNIKNSLTQEYPEGILAHEFAHIRQCYDRGILELLFESSCPRDARNLASIFLTELEEVVADSLLPSSWRNDKNRAILRWIERYPEVPHPFFLAALKTTTDFRKEDIRLFRKVNSKIESDPMLRLSFETGLQCFRYFYVRKRIRPEDVNIIEEGINKILGNLFGTTHRCHVRLRAHWKRFAYNGRFLVPTRFNTFIKHFHQTILEDSSPCSRWIC